MNNQAVTQGEQKMLYLRYAIGILIMIVLFSFYKWIWADLKEMAYGKKQKKRKKHR